MTPSDTPLKPVMRPSTKPPVMGLADAARVCGVSVSTVRRKREELVQYGAAQTAKGWQIPVTALIAVGLMDRTTAPGEPPSVDTPDAPYDASDASDAPIDTRTEPLIELESLRSQLADAERRAAVAEAIAAERERIIQIQQASLRMLEAGRPKPETPGFERSESSAPPSGSSQQVPGVAGTAGNSSERPPADTPRGTPQGAPFWRRWFGLR